jgi:hypothetical protein
VDDIVVGDDVTIYGYGVRPDTILARKVLVHRRLVAMDGIIVSVATGELTVTGATGNTRVLMSDLTALSGDVPATGLAVHVTGYLRGDGVILATAVRVGKKRAA